MKAYKGSFKKKNGDSRKMVFGRLYTDSLKRRSRIWKFLNDKVQGAGSEQTYPEGMELVHGNFMIQTQTTLEYSTGKQLKVYQ